MRGAIVLLFLAAITRTCADCTVYAVQASATVAKNPPAITLHWAPNADAAGYTIWRKERDATTWNWMVGKVDAGTHDFTDTAVAAGQPYEYRIVKRSTTPPIKKKHKNGEEDNADFAGYGYVYAGIDVPLVEDCGKIILLVDATMAAPLKSELARLEDDLIGDGWTVLHHDIARTTPVPQVKAQIVADYAQDPAHVKSLFLFGHIPVPYSGNLNPDGHGNHQGAWPADVYYGTMTGTWTDTTVDTGKNKTAPADPRTRNVPGDGKFDQSQLPANVDLEIGRVDLSNLPVFPQSETGLLRQYLNKDHAYRIGEIAPPTTGFVDDEFGDPWYEGLASSGWRLAACVRADHLSAQKFFAAAASGNYLWAYADGPGGYNLSIHVGQSVDFTKAPLHAVFAAFWGSYFGDWDSPDNFLRAPLANSGNILTSAWAGRPAWYFHHMALGEPIGFSAKITQNNNGQTYQTGLNWPGPRYVHVALMGDPTLRLKMIKPPQNVRATNTGNHTHLTWTAPHDTIDGYLVYRSTVHGWERITPSPIITTRFDDTVAAPVVPRYMVRATRLETSTGGTYQNASEGVIVSAANDNP